VVKVIFEFGQLVGLAFEVQLASVDVVICQMVSMKTTTVYLYSAE